MNIKNESPLIDGRKQRTSQSRQKIVDAMLYFIRQGVMSPSAEQVAEKAEVGLRTVFRRFSEMEKLYQEISLEVMRIIKSEIVRPLDGDHWKEKLNNFVRRRLSIYEVIKPYRTAARYHMHTSKFMRDDLFYWVEFEKNILSRFFPVKEQDDKILFNAVNACASFDYWFTLIEMQGLTVEEASEIIHRTIDNLIVDIPN